MLNVFHLGTILLDTVNMSEAAGRKTVTDEVIADRLASLCPEIDRQRLFDGIQSAKFDISGNQLTSSCACLIANRLYKLSIQSQ